MAASTSALKPAGPPPGGELPPARSSGVAEPHEQVRSLSMALEFAVEGVSRLDLAGRYLYVNPAYAAMVGYPTAALAGMHWQLTTHPKDFERIDTAIERMLADGKAITEVRGIRKDGSVFQCQLVLVCDYDANYRRCGHYGFMKDITARKEAEQHLRISEAQLVEAQAIADTGSFVWDLTTGDFLMSAQLHRIGGVKPGTLPPSYEALSGMLYPDDRDALRDAVTGTLADGHPYAMEVRLVRSDGTVRQVISRGQIIRDESGLATRLVGTVQDITDRKTMEARLMIADRMSSLGTLAGGVAHEINNPLAYIMANLEFADKTLREMAEATRDTRALELIEALSEARQGAERVRRIVRDLKTFSRADEQEMGPVDLRSVVELSINMTRNEIRHRARLVRDFGDTPPVYGSESRLGQVVVNLLVNAVQAIPEGAAERSEIRVVTRREGKDSVVLEVSDTGCGIPAALQSRIFDPFFTTKTVGVGTGLGLSICHNIIASFAGSLAVESEVGKGSTFRVTLKATRAEATASPQAPSVPTAATRRQRVLIVDDEPFVGKALKRILESQFEVETAENGRDGLCRITSGKPLDFVFCDLMMPEMTGMDLYGALTVVAPQQVGKMIFMTGGAFTPAAKAFLQTVANPCLEKPLDLATVRALLGKLASDR